MKTPAFTCTLEHLRVKISGESYQIMVWVESEDATAWRGSRVIVDAQASDLPTREIFLKTDWTRKKVEG